METTSIDRSTMAAIVYRLVQRKLVSRRRARTDSRSYIVRLTEEGMSALQMAGPIVQRVDDDFVSVLLPEERSALTELLDKILQTSSDPEETGPPNKLRFDQALT